ncbi:PREDICTED: guanylin-like [Acanthisitta chloris]|uniref:guanylin-like n=1 Tax=Acanthisitta chloris TaxID=57068 RepID=UPI0004F0D06B|nr:PREDICTED: guanylin-like [Acanthisitta chloris]
MRGFLPCAVLALVVLVHSSGAVYVQDGDLQFPLESVKKLKELMDDTRRVNPRMVLPVASSSVCEETNLPKEFLPVCKRQDAPMIFQRLSLAAQDDLCEICANAACAGCL